MAPNTGPRNSGSITDKSSAVRPGRHSGPGDAQTASFPAPLRDRTIERINAADLALAEAQARLKNLGVDPDTLNAAFAAARDSLYEARELTVQARRELAMAHYEWDQASRKRRDTGLHPETASPVVPDMPGLDLCPNPGNAQTPADFMGTLRMYHIWAGKPSYRTLEHQSGRRFAASTFHAALKGDELAALPLVQAVITACGGSDDHRQVFASAWRRLKMRQQDDSAQPAASGALPTSSDIE